MILAFCHICHTFFLFAKITYVLKGYFCYIFCIFTLTLFENTGESEKNPPLEADFHTSQLNLEGIVVDFTGAIYVIHSFLLF
jgi:hypothetical protein